MSKKPRIPRRKGYKIIKGVEYYTQMQTPVTKEQATAFLNKKKNQWNKNAKYSPLYAGFNYDIRMIESKQQPGLYFVYTNNTVSNFNDYERKFKERSRSQIIGIAQWFVNDIVHVIYVYVNYVENIPSYFKIQYYIDNKLRTEEIFPVKEINKLIEIRDTVIKYGYRWTNDPVKEFNILIQRQQGT